MPGDAAAAGSSAAAASASTTSASLLPQYDPLDDPYDPRKSEYIEQVSKYEEGIIAYNQMKGQLFALQHALLHRTDPPFVLDHYSRISWAVATCMLRQKSETGLDKGMREYQEGNYEDAIETWASTRQSIRYILDKQLCEDDVNQLKEVYVMEINVYNNMAWGSFKTGDWTKAIQCADMALRILPSHEKASFIKQRSQRLSRLESIIKVDSKALVAAARRAKAPRWGPGAGLLG